jgi:hypothetical protein
VEGGGGVEAAGEGDADALAEGEGFEDDGHDAFRVMQNSVAARG